MVKPNNRTDDYRQRYVGVRAIVLGATGFIGRWVARELCRAGANVILAVRDRASAEVIFEAYDIDGDIFELDFCDSESLQSLYQDVRPTVTFNLSGYGIDRAEQEAELAYQINCDLVKNLCEAISKISDPAWTGQDVVNVGTAMEYGLTGGDLVEESEARPTTLYGKSKLTGTHMLRQCCQSFELKGVTARLFAVYGPGELPQRLLPTLVRATWSGIPIPLTAGVHKRDFVYVEDAAESLLRLGLTSTGPGEVVNVATGVLNPVKTFVEAAAAALGISHQRLRFGVLPTRKEEMDHDPVSIRRLAELTGWVPRTTISEGVWKTLSFADLAVIEATIGGVG